MEASFWRSDNGSLSCLLCPHNCSIPVGKQGLCRVRENREGALVSTNYARVSGLSLDPVEKKPLYHFCPGELVLSVGAPGCNLDCGFCQNHEAKEGKWPTRHMSPEQLVDLALSLQEQGNCGIAWTYTEPLVWYEYVRDSAILARESGLKTILVTNGYANPEPWQQLLQHIDAVNIDLKAFDPGFYQRHCRGTLEPVLASIKSAARMCHVEVTTLLIEGVNSDTKQLSELFRFLADINPEIPLHISRYYPARHWSQPATDPGLLLDRVEMAREWLHHVYAGNLPDCRLETRCHHCKTLLADRYPVKIYLTDGCCPRCGKKPYIQLQEE